MKFDSDKHGFRAILHMVHSSQVRTGAKTRIGFTLIEVLVVIAIIGVLIALILPAVQAAHEAGRRTECLNHVKQIGLATHNFENSHKLFPPSSDSAIAPGNGRAKEFSYLVSILPYTEETALNSQIDPQYYWGDAANVTAFSTPVPQFKCPSKDPTEKLLVPVIGTYEFRDSFLASHYAAVLGAKNNCPGALGDPYTLRTPTDCWQGGAANNGIMYIGSKTRIGDVTDGTTKTFLIGEFSWNYRGGRPWMVGASQTLDDNLQPQGFVFSYAGKNMSNAFGSSVWYLDDTYDPAKRIRITMLVLVHCTLVARILAKPTARQVSFQKISILKF